MTLPRRGITNAANDEETQQCRSLGTGLGELIAPVDGRRFQASGNVVAKLAGDRSASQQLIIEALTQWIEYNAKDPRVPLAQALIKKETPS